MKKTDPPHSAQQPHAATLTLGKTKAVLESYLRNQSLPPSEEYVQSLLDAIRALPIAEWKKRVLLRFHDPTEPQPTSEKEYCKLDKLVCAISKKLRDTKEARLFHALCLQGDGTALATSLMTVAWRYSSDALRKRWEQERDTQALGAVVGAIEAVGRSSRR